MNVRCSIFGLLLYGLFAANFAIADRPNAMRLVPGRSVFFARTADASELSERFNNGSGGKLMTDPEMGRFLRVLYAQLDEAFRSGPGRATGGGLNDLLQLFEGELALAVVPRRNEFPGLVFIADTVSGADRALADEQALAVGKARAAELIAAAEARGRERGVAVADELIGSVRVTVMRPGSDATKAFGLFERDGTLVVSNDRVLLESVVSKWDEAEGLVMPVDEATDSFVPATDDTRRESRLRQRYQDPLSNNPRFTESIRECVSERLGGGDESPPQLIAYVDPVGIFRAVAQQNASMRFALATLPILGLDGIEGLAGAAWINEGQWESLIRGHLLLKNPRAGVLKMLRLEPCDYTPSNLIPADVSGYTCGALSFDALLAGAGQLYDQIRGEGDFDKLLSDQFTTKTGVTIQQLVANLTGRVMTIRGFAEAPAGTAASVRPGRVTCLQVTDSESALATLEEILGRVKPETKWREYGGFRYAQFDGFEPAQFREARPPRRIFLACAAVIEDQLVLSDSQALLHKVIDTYRGDGDQLVNHLPFRLMANRAKRLGAGTVAASEGRLLVYEDPYVQFRQWHVAGTNEESLQQLSKFAEIAPPMRWLRDTIDEVGVPSVEAMQQFANNSGAALYDTPRGFRYVAFSYKLDEE